MVDPVSLPEYTSRLRFKDISDWVKVLVATGSILFGGYAGYVRMSDKVDGHTQQLREVKEQIEGLRSDSNASRERTNETIGRIEMYLSSKDKDYWKTVQH